MDHLRPTRPYLGLAAWVFLVSACADPPPPLTATVHGAVTIDTSRVPAFEAGGAAVVRVAGGQGHAVTLVQGDARHPAKVQAEPRDDAVLLRVVLPAVKPGAYALEIAAKGFKPMRQAVLIRRPARAVLEAHAAEIAKAPAGERAKRWQAVELLGSDAHWARVEVARAHRAAGDLAASVEAWLAAAAKVPPGLASERSRCLRAAIHGLIWARRLDRVDPLLEEAAQLDERLGDDAGRSRIAFYRGLLALERGDYRTAMAETDKAAGLAYRVGFDAGWVTAEEQRSAILVRQGRFKDARERLAPLAEWTRAHGTAADRARFATNQAWTEIAGARLGHEGDLAGARARLEAVLAEAPKDAWYAANVHANLATIALLQGAVPRAQTHLDAAGQDTGYTALLAGEVALAEGRLEPAARAFEQARSLSLAESGDGRDDVQWRALHGAARVKARQGADAAAAFDRALAALAAVGARTEVLQDRAPFFTGRRALVDDAAGWFLKSGRPERAFEVLDAARARVVRALAAQASMGALDQAERGQLAALDARYEAARQAAVERAAVCARAVDGAKGECVVRLAQARDTATAAFDARQAFLDARSGAAAKASAEAIARALPQGTAVVALDRVGDALHAFVIDTAGLRHRTVERAADALDGLAAPWVYAVGQVRGLHRERPVAYLPYAALVLLERPKAEGPPLVVADPTRDLPQALAEGKAVAARVGGKALFGDAATASAVTAALDGARLFHFAGHGSLTAGSPWDAHLALADGTRLALTSLFVHRPATGVVVLSGCETGYDQTLAGAESVSLADGFMLAGGRAVLATDRKVEDQAARRFVDAFYTAGGADQPMQAYLTARRTLAHDPIASAFQLTARP